MEIKINRYTFNVTNRDWILDNGVCYQCMTLMHRVYEPSVRCSVEYITKMSKQQFNALKKRGILVPFRNKQLTDRYAGCKFWKFDLECANDE